VQKNYFVYTCMNVRCSLNGGWRANQQTKQHEFFPAKREKNTRKLIELKKMTFFEMCLDEISYDTPYLQDCNEKKKCLKRFFS
jgi:hypothetical protein